MFTVGEGEGGVSLLDGIEGTLQSGYHQLVLGRRQRSVGAVVAVSAIGAVGTVGSLVAGSRVVVAAIGGVGVVLGRGRGRAGDLDV